MLVEESNLWLWQIVAIIIYCFSFCRWTVNIILSVLTWIEWTHVELYNLSQINLRLWWMYHLCGCDEKSPTLSLACSFGCIIPSVFTCWSGHTVNFISYQTKILFNEFVFWLWLKLLISGLNVLFLAQTPLLYVFYFNTLYFLKLMCFFVEFPHFYSRILSRQTFTRFL